MEWAQPWLLTGEDYLSHPLPCTPVYIIHTSCHPRLFNVIAKFSNWVDCFIESTMLSAILGCTKGSSMNGKWSYRMPSMGWELYGICWSCWTFLVKFEMSHEGVCWTRCVCMLVILMKMINSAWDILIFEWVGSWNQKQISLYAQKCLDSPKYQICRSPKNDRCQAWVFSPEET